MERKKFPFFVNSDHLAPTASTEIFDKFKSADVRIALQKDGELTALSASFLRSFGITSTEDLLKSKRLVHVIGSPSVGVLLTKNKAIGEHVATGRVDCAILGQDRVIEEGLEQLVDEIHIFEEYQWPIVLALPRRLVARHATPELRQIATQYPRIAERGFRRLGLTGVQIVPTLGGTEAYPYVVGGCDGIVDMRVTGKSLEEHDLVAFEPPLEVVSPVLVARKEKVDIVRRIIMNERGEI